MCSEGREFLNVEYSMRNVSKNEQGTLGYYVHTTLVLKWPGSGEGKEGWIRSIDTTVSSGNEGCWVLTGGERIDRSRVRY